MTVEKFQLTAEAAEIYESRFVPAMFAEWAPHLVDAAAISSGQSVLDVACGTGIVARAAADRLNGRVKIVGVDINPAMLAVARRLRPEIEWQEGDAQALPFEEASFDVVVCQAALMFFPDPTEAVREMARVVKQSGAVALQVWSSLESQPGYGPFVAMAARHAGPDAVSLLSAYWTLGDLDALGTMIERAGLRVTGVVTRLGTARFPSVDAFVRTEVESTPLLERMSAETYQRILTEAEDVMAPFQALPGGLEVPIEGHIVNARK